MAKALFGHVGTADSRLLAEVRRLRVRVRDLEDEVARVSAERDALAAPVSGVVLDDFDAHLQAADLREPALA